MSSVIGGQGIDGKLIVVGASGEPIEVSPLLLIGARRSIAGWPSGTALDSEDTPEIQRAVGRAPGDRNLSVGESRRGLSAHDERQGSLSRGPEGSLSARVIRRPPDYSPSSKSECRRGQGHPALGPLVMLSPKPYPLFFAAPRRPTSIFVMCLYLHWQVSGAELLRKRQPRRKVGIEESLFAGHLCRPAA